MVEKEACFTKGTCFYLVSQTNWLCLAINLTNVSNAQGKKEFTGYLVNQTKDQNKHTDEFEILWRNCVPDTNPV